MWSYQWWFRLWQRQQHQQQRQQRQWQSFCLEYNATVYNERENTAAAVHLSRLSASPSLADVGASIAPDLTTLSRNGLIAAANESNESTEIFGVWSCSFARNHVVNAESITDQ